MQANDHDETVRQHQELWTLVSDAFRKLERKEGEHIHVVRLTWDDDSGPQSSVAVLAANSLREAGVSERGNLFYRLTSGVTPDKYLEAIAISQVLLEKSVKTLGSD